MLNHKLINICSFQRMKPGVPKNSVSLTDVQDFSMVDLIFRANLYFKKDICAYHFLGYCSRVKVDLECSSL